MFQTSLTDADQGLPPSLLLDSFSAGSIGTPSGSAPSPHNGMDGYFFCQLLLLIVLHLCRGLHKVSYYSRFLTIISIMYMRHFQRIKLLEPDSDKSSLKWTLTQLGGSLSRHLLLVFLFRQARDEKHCLKLILEDRCVQTCDSDHLGFLIFQNAACDKEMRKIKQIWIHYLNEYP